MNSGIYKLTSPSGKSYIGQSKNLKRRKEQFLKQKIYSRGKKLEEARLKYPDYNQWQYTVLEYCDEDLLNEREQYWISYYDTYKYGYNSTIGGDQGKLGIIVSNERRKKQSESMKGKKPWNKGLTVGKMSDENKMKLVIARGQKIYAIFSNEKHEYNSIRECERYTNIDHHLIKYHIISNTPFTKENITYTFGFINNNQK